MQLEAEALCTCINLEMAVPVLDNCSCITFCEQPNMEPWPVKVLHLPWTFCNHEQLHSATAAYAVTCAALLQPQFEIEIHMNFSKL